MAREIDMSGDLSKLPYEDQVYLAQRNRLPFDVVSEDEQREMLRTSDEVGFEQRANTGDTNTANLTVEQLEELLAVKRAEQEAVNTVKLFGKEGVAGAEDADEDEDEDDDEDEQDADALEPPYAQYTNAQLTAEISRRNELRDEDDQLDLTGNKAELVATLELDDEDEE